MLTQQELDRLNHFLAWLVDTEHDFIVLSYGSKWEQVQCREVYEKIMAHYLYDVRQEYAESSALLFP